MRARKNARTHTFACPVVSLDLSVRDRWKEKARELLRVLYLCIEMKWLGCVCCCGVAVSVETVASEAPAPAAPSQILCCSFLVGWCSGMWNFAALSVACVLVCVGTNLTLFSIHYLSFMDRFPSIPLISSSWMLCYCYCWNGHDGAFVGSYVRCCFYLD